MEMKKKGFFFTLIALLVLSICLIIFTYTPAKTPQASLYSQKAKIDVITSFTKDLKDTYLKRVLYNSASHALNIMLKNISESKTPIDNIDLRAKELLFNGSFYNIAHKEMENQTLNYWSDKIKEIAKDHFKITSNITFYDLIIYQEDPWSLLFSVDAIIKANYSEITYDTVINIVINISIINKDDPLFLIHNENLSIDPVQVEEWNTTTLIYHIKSKKFRHTSWSPNFLSRMQNITTISECCGIESLFNRSKNVNYSSVDFFFWNQTGCVPYGLFNITDVWDEVNNFKIDGVHLYLYGFNTNMSNVEQIC